jgi:hypothetical protein
MIEMKTYEFFPSANHLRLAVKELLPKGQEGKVERVTEALRREIKKGFKGEYAIWKEHRFAKKQDSGNDLTFQVRKVGLDLHLSISKKRPTEIPFTVQALKLDQNYYLHFFSESQDGQETVEGKKKAQPSLYLKVPKGTDPSALLPFERSLYYSVQKKDAEDVLKGVELQRKVVEKHGNALFVEAPILHRIRNNGVLEMKGAVQDGNLTTALVEDRLTVLQKIDVSLNVVKAVALLAQMDPLVIHSDIRPDHVFFNGSSARLGCFDKARTLSKEREDETYYYHASCLFNLGEISPKLDLYSLTILMADMLCPGFAACFPFFFFQNDLAKCVLDPLCTNLSGLALCKEKVSLQTARKIQELFLGKDPIKQLAIYAKSLQGSLDFAAVSEFVLECAAFQPLFEILFQTLSEEEKAKKAKEEGVDPQEILENYNIFFAEKMQQLLESAKDRALLITRFWEEKVEEEALDSLQEEASILIEQEMQVVPQHFEEFRKILPLQEDFSDKINQYLRFAKDKPFRFFFDQEDPKSLLGKVPFSGVIEKTREGLVIYAVVDSQRSFSFFIPKNPLQEKKPSVKEALYKSVCFTDRESYFQEWLQLKMRSIDEMPVIATVDMNKGILHLCYDATTLISKKDELSIKQKAKVCLDLLEAIQSLHEKDLIHEAIDLNAVLLEMKEDESVRARLCNKPKTNFEGSRVVSHGNTAHRYGLTFQETDLFSFMELADELFDKENESTIRSRMAPLQESIEKTEKRIADYLEQGGQLEEEDEQEEEITDILEQFPYPTLEELKSVFKEMLEEKKTSNDQALCMSL